MHVAIDIREAARLDRAGKGAYALAITREVLALAPHDRFTLLSDAPCAELAAPNAKVQVLRGRGLAWQAEALARLTAAPPDVFFAPTSYILPALLPRRVRRVVTVHDLVAFRFPDTHRRKSVWIERLTLDRAMRRASAVLAVSRHTERDLRARLPGLRAPVRLTPCAVDVERLASAAPPDEALRARLRLPKHYVLAVGTLEPRKNLRGLLEAFARAGPRLEGIALVLAGKAGWGNESLETLVQQLGLAGRVLRTGYVSDAELARLYAGARAFAFPSLYEGFGIPPLEAMAAGCPLVASDAASLPEVVGEAGLLVDPHDRDALADALVRAVHDETARDALRAKGHAQARRFSWRSSAEVVLEALRQAASA